MTQKNITELISHQIKVVSRWQTLAERSAELAVAQGLGTVIMDLIRLHELESLTKGG